jgi:hypothetical protein
MKTVVALYDDFTDAQAVVRDLVKTGVARKNISLVTSDRDQRYAAELDDLDADGDGNHAAEGAGAGAVAGTFVGGIGGLLVGLGALAIPGIGPIVAAGPIGAALLGAGIGAAAGGLIGALIGWGIPEEEAHYFAEGVRRGGTLIGVTTPAEDVDLVTDVLNRYNPVDLEKRSADWRTTGWTRFDETAEPYKATTTTANLGTTRGAYARSYAREGSFDDVDYGDDFDAYELSYRRHYDTNYANTGFDYVDYQDAYRFGSTLGTDTRYTTYGDWNSFEPVARTQWEETHDSAWDDFKDAVRHGWNEMKEAVS